MLFSSVPYSNNILSAKYCDVQLKYIDRVLTLTFLKIGTELEPFPKIISNSFQQFFNRIGFNKELKKEENVPCLCLPSATLL